jgi:hypothetical protein
MNPLGRVEELIAQIDACADPNVRAAARGLVEALMEFHGNAAARMMEMVDSGTALAMGRDETIRPLLLLYDLHPESTEIRVRREIDRIRNVELIGVEDLEVQVRLTGNGHSPSRESIEKAIQEAAPEIRSIQIEGLKTPDFVPLASLLAV